MVKAKIISRYIDIRIDGSLKVKEIISVPRGIASSANEIIVSIIPKEKAYNYLLKNEPEAAKEYKKDFGDKYCYYNIKKLKY